MNPADVQKEWGTIPQALASFGEGIGRAAREVVMASRTPIGALAIKQAELTIELELAAATDEMYVEGKAPEAGGHFGDGAGGLGQLVFKSARVGVSRDQVTASNKAIVKLTIVAIPPTDEPALPAIWPWGKWTIKDVQAAADALERMLGAFDKSAIVGLAGSAHAAPARIGGTLPGVVVGKLPFAKARKQVAVAVEHLVDLAADPDPAEMASNPDGATLFQQMHALVTLLDGDAHDDDLVRSVPLAAVVRAIESYLKGVLAGSR